MPTLDKQIENAEKRERLSRLKLADVQNRAMYEAVEEGRKKQRHSPKIEFGDEQTLNLTRDRLKGIATTRDQYRNYAISKNHVRTIVNNAIGTDIKLVLYPSEDESNKAAARWFNRDWSRDCEARQGWHRNDLNKLILTQFLREGDIVAFFDRGGVIPGGEGKVWLWEPDQIVNLSDQEFKKKRAAITDQLGPFYEGKYGITLKDADLSQGDGVILDKWGRTLGYMVHNKHGMTIAKADDVTILPRGPARLIMQPWRVNTVRGMSELLTIANDTQHVREIREAALMRMKVQSFIVMAIKKADAAQAGLTRSGNDATVAAAGTMGDNYENFEKITRGAIEYLGNGEEVQNLSLPGDSVDIETMLKYATASSGMGLGLAKAYALAESASSYSAGMFEGNMTWPTFRAYSKHMERYVLDWEAEEALTWGVERGKIKGLADGWKDNLGWTGWPERMAINPAAEANAKKTRLSIGDLDWADMLGPDWREKLASLGEQIKAGRDAGFFTPVFEPKPQSNGGQNNG